MYIFSLIFFLFLFLVLSVKKPAWAAMAIVAGLPLYLFRFDLFGLPMTLLEAMILIAFFVWLVSKTHFKDFIRGRYGLKEFLKNSPFRRGGSSENRSFYPFGVEISLLLIVSFVAAGVAGFSLSALGLWKAYFFEPALLYILILNVLPGRGGLNKIGLSLAVSAFAVSVYAVFQKITGLGIDNPLWAAEATRRAVSFFGYPNAIGLYLGPIIPFLAAFLFLPAKKELAPGEGKLYFPLKRGNISTLGLSKGFLNFILILSLLAIFFARSEGALVGLAAAFVFCGLFWNKKARIAVLVLAAAAGVFLAASPSAFKTVERKLSLMDFSGQLRRYQWKETLIMLNDGRFFTGAGLGNYQETIKPYHQEGFFYDDGTDPNFHQHTLESAEYRAKTWQPVEIYLYPHNLVLNFWSELGFFGLLLFLWMIGRFFVASGRLVFRLKNKADRPLVLGLAGAMIVIIIHGFVDVPYFKNDLSCLFWILMAILAILDLGEKNKKTRDGVL